MATPRTIYGVLSARYAVVLFLFLIAAGLAVNYFPFSIINAHFIFGSIFAMLALQFFGWGRGILAAGMISAYTFFVWNHPWAFITMTAEAATVGWLFTRRRLHLVAADFLYWLFIGIPLGFFCFHIVSDLPLNSALFLMTKQAVNGVANALIARLIYSGIAGYLKTNRIPLKELLSNLLVFFALTPAIALITHDGGIDITETDRHIRVDLIRDSRNITDGLQTWFAERKAAVIHLAALAKELPAAEMQARLEQAHASDAGFSRLCLLDENDIAIAYSPRVDELGRSTIGKNFADRPYLPVLRQSLRPMLSEVMPSRFSRSGTVAILLAPVLENGAYAGAVGGILNFDRIANLMALTAAGQEIRYSLLDKNNRVIFSNRRDLKVMAPFSMGKGSFALITGLHKKSVPPVMQGVNNPSAHREGIKQWFPTLPAGTSTIELWGKSSYVAESVIQTPGAWKLILEQPIAPFQKRLYAEYCEKFYILFAILIASLALAEWASRQTVAAIDGLVSLTRNLPSKVASNEKITWKNSIILETDHLIENVKTMAGSLRDQFVEIQQTNESLEDQVAKRTRTLSDREAFLRNILDNIPAMIFVKDAQTLCYVNMNRAGENLLGYSRDEITGRRDSDIFSEEEAAFFAEKDREALSDGRLVDIPEGKVQTRRSGLRTLHIRLIPVTDEKKSPRYIIGIAEDITEKKINRDALEEANRKLLLNQTAILNIMEDLKTENLARKQNQSRIVHLNQVLRAIRDVNQLIVRERDRENLIREGCRLLVANRGYPSAMIVLTDDRNRPISWAMEGAASVSPELTEMMEQGILPGCCSRAHAEKGVVVIDDRNAVCRDCPIAAACVESQSMCVKLDHEDETFGYLAVAAEKRLVIDEEERGLFQEMAGDFAYALSVMMIEKKHDQTRRALRKSEEKYHDMLLNLMEGFYCVTPDGVLLDYNKEFLNILKLDPEKEYIGLSVAGFWQNPEDRKPYLKELEKTGFIKNYEIRLIDAHGKNIIVRAGARMVRGKQGDPVQIEGSFLDITEQKNAAKEREKLQSQLIQAQKMESVGRLAGGVAHDFNNMLSVIIGFTELAMGKARPEDSLYNDLNEVLAAARRSADITRQLLAFARRQTIDPKALDLNETVEEMLKMLRRLIGEDIDLSWRPGSGRMPVFMDPSQLDQILANLCVNARDAIGGVGKITIETGHVYFDPDYCADHVGFLPGDYIMLAVSDDGCGMERDMMDSIFEPFFTTKGVGEGTGLGLATVYGIVTQNEGFINVYSEPGKGTIFKIYLPPHEREDAGIKTIGTTTIPAGRGETVLIVEDEAAVLKLSRRILESLNYTALTADSPGAAIKLALAYKNKIHLLITDVVMPEMNGRELAETVKAYYPDLKILFMSGYTANVIAHRGILDDGVNFIQKPFSSRDLAVKVREALET